MEWINSFEYQPPPKWPFTPFHTVHSLQYQPPPSGHSLPFIQYIPCSINPPPSGHSLPFIQYIPCSINPPSGHSLPFIQYIPCSINPPPKWPFTPFHTVHSLQYQPPQVAVHSFSYSMFIAVHPPQPGLSLSVIFYLIESVFIFLVWAVITFSFSGAPLRISFCLQLITHSETLWISALNVALSDWSFVALYFSLACFISFNCDFIKILSFFAFFCCVVCLCLFLFCGVFTGVFWTSLEFPSYWLGPRNCCPSN